MVEHESVEHVKRIAAAGRKRRVVGAATEREHGKPTPVPEDPEPWVPPPDPPNETTPHEGAGRVDSNNLLAFRLPWVIPEELPQPIAEHAGLLMWDITRGRIVVCDGTRWRTIPLSVT